MPLLAVGAHAKERMVETNHALDAILSAAHTPLFTQNLRKPLRPSFRKHPKTIEALTTLEWHACCT